MKIYDDKNNLLAVFIKKDDIKEVRNFETSNDEEFQIGSFNLEKNTIIESHIHLNQKRIISKTSEALVVIEGEMEVTIYDNERKFIEKLLVQDGDTIALLNGGHGIKINSQCRFVEIKQGPYIEEEDKVRF
jgi:cupin fold WbuC family metalloprotein